MAWLDFQPKTVEGLSVKGGKFKNPFYKPGESELVWDSDLNPEGGVATLKRDFDDVSLMLLGAGMWIEERSSKKDSWMGAGQGILRFHTNENKSNVAVGGSYFGYVNVKGFGAFFDSDEPLGNSVDTLGQYLKTVRRLSNT